MTAEEALEILNGNKDVWRELGYESIREFNKDWDIAFDMAIQALKQEPCEDCISRQALIEKATSWDKHFADSERCVSLTDIQNAPSVTPKAKMGRWIEERNDYGEINALALLKLL